MSREHHRLNQEEGIALISVLLAVLILSGLVTVFVARAMTENQVSRHTRDHEVAIHLAEAATDDQIARVQACRQERETSTDAGCVKVTSSPDEYGYGTLDENSLTIEYPPPGDEESWAEGLLADLDGSDSFISTDRGEAYAFRPVDGSGVPVNIVFGVSAVPSFDHADNRTRVVKLQIAQDLYSPDNAITSNGDLTFGGNAEVIAPNCDEAAPIRADCNADIHVNDTMKTQPGSTTIHGRVTVAGGDCPDTSAEFGCQDQNDSVEPQLVPEILARDFYGRELNNLNPDQGGQDVGWFDLCPDGRVRPQSPSGPCTSASVLWPDPTTPEGSTTTFRGWKYKNNGGGITWSGNAIGSGVFYVYHGDASVNGSAGSVPRAVSIFVETNPSDLSRTGSLSVSGNPNLEAAFPDVLIVTDADLDLSGNASVSDCNVTPEALSGFISVREQLKTTGTVTIRGALVIQDAAHEHPLVSDTNDKIQGTMCLEYDEDLDIDLAGFFTITFWNEL